MSVCIFLCVFVVWVCVGVGCVCGGVMVEVVGERGGSGGFNKNGLCLYPWDSNVKGHTNK